MGSASSFLGGGFLKAEALKTGGPVRGLITGTSVETFKAKPGEGIDKQQLAITIDTGADEKKFTLNMTNLRALIAAYGDDYDGWTGKSVIVYYDPNVTFGGRTVGGARVKVPSAKTPAPVVREREPGDDDDDTVF